MLRILVAYDPDSAFPAKLADLLAKQRANNAADTSAT